MRTNLNIDDDILLAAKELARREKKSLGHVISDLARRAFATPPPSPTDADAQAPSKVSERLTSYGIHPLPKRGGVVSNELIDRLRDAEGI